MTARSTSRSRASCCCPCGLVPVVTVAAGTSWGDATPCYASHHMMLVLLYGLGMPNYTCTEYVERNLSLIHISEPTRPLYISYAVFCLKKKTDRL